MLIKNASLVDATGIKKADLLIENGKISKISSCIDSSHHTQVIDAIGKIVMPSFIDLHCHFRTPGFEYKEDLTTGSMAAAAGGYTLVNCMANTNPICSNAKIAQEVMEKAEEIGICSVNQVVSITKNFDGTDVSHLDALPEEIKIISDDGKGVTSALTMLKAMNIAQKKGLTIMSHAEDMELSPVDYRLAEDLETIRNVELAKATGAHLHMSHVSTIGAAKAILNGKEQGANVTFEVAPHHIWFSENKYRVNPPIRTSADVEFLIDLIKNGQVDAIATDHAPHSEEDKAKGAPGMIGLETAFSVCYTKLCLQKGVPLEVLSKMLSENPAKILKADKGLLREGFDGDIVIVDINKTYKVDKEKMKSKSKNTPWHGETLTGKIITTIKGGKITFEEI